jgi:hypothetical protein
MKITVTNCQQCPFCNNDCEYGKDSCNLDTEIMAEEFYLLPDDKVHDQCPLLKESYEIVVESFKIQNNTLK